MFIYGDKYIYLILVTYTSHDVLSWIAIRQFYHFWIRSYLVDDKKIEYFDKMIDLHDAFSVKSAAFS